MILNYQSEGVARTGYSVTVRGALGAGLCTGTCWRAAAAVGGTPFLKQPAALKSKDGKQGSDGRGASAPKNKRKS